MSTKDWLQKDDFGVDIQVTITDPDGTAIDISTASEVLLILKDPSAVVSTKVMTITDGPNGIATWTITTGTFATAGKWTVQVKVSWAASAVRRTLTFPLRVEDNLA